MKERLIEFLAYLKIGQKKFEQNCGLSNGFVDKVGDNITIKTLDKIVTKYPALNINWLKTGEGLMLKTENESESEFYVPLLPISAQGGSLNDFVVSVKDSDCEKIISPIKGADFAITVSGDSMAPEYPSGSKILIKKINENSFIEWGRCYVLDTCNGTVIKKLMPSNNEGRVKCVSVNPNYPEFEVSLNENDVYGIYRVLLLLTEK